MTSHLSAGVFPKYEGPSSAMRLLEVQVLIITVILVMITVIVVIVL